MNESVLSSLVTRKSQPVAVVFVRINLEQMQTNLEDVVRAAAHLDGSPAQTASCPKLFANISLCNLEKSCQRAARDRRNQLFQAFQIAVVEMTNHRAPANDAAQCIFSCVVKHKSITNYRT
jgi:hypothetical protein